MANNYPKIGYCKHEYNFSYMDREKWSKRQEFLVGELRCLRKESQQTQAQVAKKLGRPQTYVSKYELGERRLDLLEIHDICQACGITLLQFIARIEPNLECYPKCQ